MTTQAQFIIDTGIPMPERSEPKPRKAKYPFREMTAGQSTFIAGMKKKTADVLAYAWRAKGVPIYCRSTTEEEVKIDKKTGKKVKTGKTVEGVRFFREKKLRKH